MSVTVIGNPKSHASLGVGNIRVNTPSAGLLNQTPSAGVGEELVDTGGSLIFINEGNWLTIDLEDLKLTNS